MSIRQRVLVTVLALVGVIGGAIGLAVSQAPTHPVTEIQLEDTAGIIHPPTLGAGLEDILFYEPTTVAVFTHRGGPEALEDDRALNDAVLAYAREHRPDWLSADEQKFADGLYIYAIDPEGRLVGTYFGEDRLISEDRQFDVQEATKDELRAGQWTAAAVTGVEAAAERMNAPPLRRAEGILAAVFAALATAGATVPWLLVGLNRVRKSRTVRAEGDEAMANVVRDQEVTELHARLIPEDSRYGGLMLQRYDDYLKGYRELTELGNQARGLRERDWVRKESLATLTAYRDKAAEMDHLDDVIADTAALLNRDRLWREAWARQADPLREELEAVRPMLDAELTDELKALVEVATLRSFTSRALVELDRMRGRLEEGSVTPDDALDHLRTTQDELTTHLDALAGAVARRYSDDEDEQELMEESLRSNSRTRPHQPTILSTTDPLWTWFTINSFRTGYTSGVADVETSRAPASSGGSTSGFSSGGSFSGGGSSSRF